MQAQRVEKQLWQSRKENDDTTILTVRSLIGQLKEQHQHEWWDTFRALGNAL